MSLTITVDFGSALPVYEQIRSQVTAHLAVGALRVGDRLPPVRELAEDLGIAVGTVNRAYRELEIDGIVASRRRTGTRVVASPQVPVSLQRAVEGLIRAARAADLTDEALVDLVRGTQTLVE